MSTSGGIEPDGPQGPPGPSGAAGPPGDDADDGNDGPPGPQGPQGATGATGAAGPAGATGAPGPSGADGTDGDDGPPGPPGVRGADGATGATGPIGATGTPGAPGADGDDGADGLPGPRGYTGAQGPTGATGATGATGPQGAPGADGADGDDGLPGPQGARGATGATGPTGATGAQGAQGFAGQDGDDGNDGPPGAPGAPAPLDGWIPLPYTLNFSSNTTGAGNGAIVMTITGTDATAILYNGVRLRFVSGGNTVYGVVETATFSTNTTVTLARQSDYTITAGAITAPYYSLVPTSAGWPDLFNWSPTFGGFTAAVPTGAHFWQHLGGNTMQVSIGETAGGTSNAITFTISLPVTASAVANGQWQFSAAYTDNGTNGLFAGIARVLQAAQVINLFQDYAATSWTASGTKRCRSTSLIFQFG